MAEVPARYIAELPIDWRAELSASLSEPLRVSGATVAQPAIGHMALLEWIDSRAVVAPDRADHLDCARALYILATGPACAGAVLEVGGPDCALPSFGDDASYTDLDWAALRWANSETDGKLLRPSALVPAFDAAFAGFRMIPPRGSGGSLYLFGPESIAGIMLLAEPLHMTPAQVLWQTPLCLLGHIAARQAEANGVRGVARPKDQADVRRQLAAAAERERLGVAHPWQIDRPDIYGPSAEQMKARPAIQRELWELAEAYRKQHGGR